MIARIALVCLMLVCGASASHAQKISQTDRIRLAESRALIASLGDSLWAGWRTTPMALLLVSGDNEFLLWHPKPTPDFRRTGYDSLLRTAVFVRPRQFAPDRMSTLPAVRDMPTIVIGTAEQTKRRSTAWVLTIAHEHFHQWQYSQPDAMTRVRSLNLTYSDNTGAWMLNYPFPYGIAGSDSAYATFASAVREAAQDSGVDRRADVINARNRLREAVHVQDYRYLAFQLWQEGIARYTEYAMARLAGEHFTPSNAFEQLKDYDPFALIAARLRRDALIEEDVVLGRRKREAIYPVGAALGLWFDRVNPTWRSRYMRHMFAIDSLYPAVQTH